jgi:hypothetical protein
VTTHHVYLRSNCGDNNYSTWTDDVPFTTLTLPPSVTGIVTDASCYEFCNGAIDITISNGTAPFSVLWSNGAVTEDISGLCAGIYSVTVTDANSQSGTETFTVLEPNSLGVDGAAITDVSCPGLCDGSIMPYPFGGTPPYSYTWSGPYGFTSSLPELTDLCAGTYSLTLTDANLCVFTTSFDVYEPYILQVAAIKQDVSCYGASDGTMQVIAVSGGTPPYYFLWSTGATTSSITGLGPGLYFLTVTDDHGCEATTFNTIYEPSAIDVLGTVTDASCPTAADGSLNVVTTGGTPPYTFAWSNGATTESITGLLPMQYDLTVTDAAGCFSFGSWTVGQNASVCATISVSGLVNSTVCYDATSTITVAGGGQVFEVTSPGFATFIAGSKISYLPGTKVTGGGKMIGRIAPSGPWCSGSKITEVAAGPGEEPMVTDHGFFSLYPNPTSGNFTIVRKGDDLTSGFRVEIYTTNGTLMLTDDITGQKQEFRFADMPVGLYIVKVVAEGSVETFKLVKTR